MIVDGHSFPSRPLPYEDDQDADRADICIGTDRDHTPAWLRDLAVRSCESQGWRVTVDRPFAGTIVPARHLRRDNRVLSVMVEVNRALYMREETGAKRSEFPAVARSCPRAPYLIP